MILHLMLTNGQSQTEIHRHPVWTQKVPGFALNMWLKQQTGLSRDFTKLQNGINFFKYVIFLNL